MATDRKLVNYLPYFMQEYLEMQKIMEAEQSEIDNLWDAAESAFADQFIQDATENGVARWEAILGISPKDTDTLNERKFCIMAKLNQELPYTMRKLMQFLTNLCGADGYSVDMNPSEYKITIRLGLANKSSYKEVEKILKRMIPANMIPFIQIMYNSNTILSNYTHSQLAAYTHEYLRSEVLE